MSAPIQPGEIGRLRDDGLAAAGEYTALAAVASRPGGERALQLLAERCDDAAAFTWWWALAAQNTERFNSAQQLAAQLAVPGALTEAVAAHVLEKLTQHERQYPTGATVSRAEIMGRLDRTAPWVVALAHDVVADTDDRLKEVVEATLDVLGASRRPQDRAAVLELAGKQPYARRGAILARLSDPIGAEEARRIVDAIAEMRGRGAERTDWEPVAKLLGRIPIQAATEFLGGSFGHGTGRRTLLEAGLVGQLGAERLQEMLMGLDQPVVVEELLQRAAGDLPQDGVTAFSVWAHGRYTAAACAPFRQRLARGMQTPSFRGEERRKQALDGLWASALAGDEADAVADELIDATHPAELATRAAGVDGARAARQLGAATAKMLALDLPRPTDAERVEELIEATAGAARALNADFVADFVAGLMRAAVGTPAAAKLRGGLLDAVLERPDAITALAAGGGTGALTDHAARTPGHAAAVLLAAGAQLSAAQVATLLGAPPEGPPPPRRSWEPHPEPPPAGVDWTTIDSDTYLQVLEVASAWPEAVFGVLSRALAALDEPEARHPSVDILRAILAHAEAHGLAGQMGKATTEHIRRLLAQRNVEMLRAACRWIRRLDVDAGGADVARARLVLRADERRGGRQPDLSALRAELAQRHAQLALDPSLDTEQRSAHLQTAAALDPASARAAAVRLAESPTTEIRAAAARVLAETPGSPDEHANLANIAAAEDDAEVGALLQRALHRLTSGDAGEALWNLAELLDLPRDGLDLDVLIPDARHRKRFAEWVDTARARSAAEHDPGTFIEAAINVADQMVDLAVIAGYDAGLPVALKADMVDALRTNAPGRPEAGPLVTQQQRIQTFEWFPIVAALRAKRAAHPSRLGTTAPPAFLPMDLVVAKGLLREVTAGWIADMHRCARRGAAAGGPV
jgi:hypothetical protein